MASAQQESINVSTKVALEIQKKNFNTINFGGIRFPRFDGSAIDAWEIVQQIELLYTSNNWPTGSRGSNPEGNHLKGGVTHQINPWNGQVNWNCSQYAVRNAVAAGAGALGQLPELANQSWANLDLDGVRIIDGAVLTAHAGYDQARVSRPILAGRHAPNPGGQTTGQYEPINDQRRSKQIIDKITGLFTGIARQKWLSTLENARPRCWEDLRWEGQVVRADGRYGMKSWLLLNFISPAFKTAKYNELQDLSWLTYPVKRSQQTGQTEPRNMPDFISYYKMALEISEMNFGAIQNERKEFLKRIPPSIVQEIRRWQGQGHMNPTMDELYEQAQNHEIQMTDASFYYNVAPLTQRYMKGKNKQQDIAELIYGVNDISLYSDNLCVQQIELEENNISGTFSGGLRNNKKGFGGSFRSDNKCFLCGAEDHWAKDCPSKKQRNTKAMNRSNSRNRKGKLRIERQNNKKRSNSRSRNYNKEWQPTDIKPLKAQQYTNNKSTYSLSSRERSINQSRKNRNWKPRRFVTINNIQYIEYENGILEEKTGQHNNYCNNQYYEIQNVNQSDDDSQSNDQSDDQ